MSRKPAAPPELEPPAHLNAAALDHWHRIVAAHPQITAIDRDVLALYVTTLVRLQDAEAELARGALTYETKTGYTRPHPLVKVVDACTRTTAKLAAELQLTPAAREKAAKRTHWLEPWDAPRSQAGSQ
jgi:P27 family predicted phage terminase small subunit